MNGIDTLEGSAGGQTHVATGSENRFVALAELKLDLARSSARSRGRCTGCLGTGRKSHRSPCSASSWPCDECRGTGKGNTEVAGSDPAQ